MGRDHHAVRGSDPEFGGDPGVELRGRLEYPQRFDAELTLEETGQACLLQRRRALGGGWLSWSA